MADSFSDLLGLRLQQTGGNDNTWGELLNTDVFEVLENAIAGLSTHATTGGALDLSATPLVHQVHKFTGILISDATVTIPNLTKTMKVHNATTGNFFLLVKTAAGTAVCIPQGTIKEIYCDGANGVYRGDRDDVGEIKHFGNATVPAGFLECDGSTPLRASTPDLFAAIGTTWGAGNGTTTYTLPDLKTAGRFLRSRSGLVAAGTYQTADIAAHNHTATASTTITSITVAADGTHNHTVTSSDSGHFHDITQLDSGGGGIRTAFMDSLGGGTPNIVLNFTTGPGVTLRSQTGFAAITSTAVAVGNHSHSGSTGTATTSVTVNNSTGTETRPINASAIACIRY